MLRRTFCHVPGVGRKTERSLWDGGLRSWDDLRRGDAHGAAGPLCGLLRKEVGRSLEHLERGDAGFFGRALPSSVQWRMFPEFRDSVAYVDIETTGLGAPGDHITSIALYDGREVRHYVFGRNLDQFARDIVNSRLLVTYNGKCFDIPWLERHYGIRLDQAHIDLRYVLSSLGYRGGLKGCEKQMGLDRGELDGVNGMFAVLLWRDYERTANPRSLETLLAYNVQDVLTLETLMVLAYNEKLSATPFGDELALPAAQPVDNPFRADRETVRRLRASLGAAW